jgi:hypothetical protein
MRISLETDPITVRGNLTAEELHNDLAALSTNEPPLMSNDVPFSDDQRGLLQIEYNNCASWYENIYQAIWTQFNYFLIATGAVLALGKDTVALPFVFALALIPLILWYWITFEPLNRYGDQLSHRAFELENIFNKKVFYLPIPSAYSADPPDPVNLEAALTDSETKNYASSPAGLKQSIRFYLRGPLTGREAERVSGKWFRKLYESVVVSRLEVRSSVRLFSLLVHVSFVLALGFGISQFGKTPESETNNSAKNTASSLTAVSLNDWKAFAANQKDIGESLKTNQNLLNNTLQALNQLQSRTGALEKKVTSLAEVP